MQPQLRRIIREELLRSIAWFGLGLVGWPLVMSEAAWVDTTALTAFGLPVLTWAVLTSGMVGLRVITESDLQVRTKAGLNIVFLGGLIITGSLVGYLVALAGWSPLPTVVSYLAITGVGGIYYWEFILPSVEAPKAG